MGDVRATSRLVLVWTGVTLVSVGVAWLGLLAALGPATTTPASVSAFDPEKLKVTPTLKPPTTSPPASPKPTRPAKPKPPKSKPGGGGQPGGKTPSRPTSPSPAPTTGSPSPTGSAPPGDGGEPGTEVRSVQTDGGSATVAVTDGRVTLRDYDPEPGFEAQGFRKSADSIVIQFFGDGHVSSVHAFLDESSALRTSVIEAGG
jgi:hypothetical protein